MKEKGEYNSNCARTACTNGVATYFNHSTLKYYCKSCAMKLNFVNKNDAIEMFGHDLCTLHKEEKV